MTVVTLLQAPLPSEDQPTLYWGNLPGASVALALSTVLSRSNQPALIITPDSMTAERLMEELQFFDTDLEVLHFPDWETLPYDHFSPHQDIISERLATLAKIPTLKKGVIICTISTLMQRLAPQEFLAHIFLIKAGDKLSIDHMREKFEKAGYYCVNQVREHGEFAVRGSIIDLFPMGHTTPFRIDLFDDEVDSIRTFSPETQRSMEKVDEIRLLPAKEFPRSEEAIEHFRQEWRRRFAGNPLNASIYQDISEGICPPGIEYYLPLFFDKTATLFDYLPNNIQFISINDAQQKAEHFWQEITERYEQGRHDQTRPLVPPQEVFISPQDIIVASHSLPQLVIKTEARNHVDYLFPFQTVPPLNIDNKASQPLGLLQQWLHAYQGRVLLGTESAGRREVLLQVLKTIGLTPKLFTSWEEFITDTTQHGIMVTPIEEGFLLTDPALALITETTLYGKRVMQRRLRKKTTQDTEVLIRDLTELQIGDPVVHMDSGIGRYQGLQTLQFGDLITEFLCLEYANNDKLYVPVSSLHLISRYTGSENAPLHRLGTENWEKAKRKATEQIRDVAAELLDIYSKRLLNKGTAFSDPNQDYAAFAAAFPFEETPDQLNAIENIITDMTAEKPMDRLICGDVGFGKTEVAMRAAFLAVQSNKQVAVLVPTTLLAQQHFQTFQDRFADWPIQIEVLSRFRSDKIKKTILEKVAEGKVDILIGTHQLLQESVKFQSLGLVIIDEEHRFGVRQKERLKSLRTNVDILNLTATPIPRTLNMAFSGMRDLSIIATPPLRRLSVKTFVHENHDHIIQEAIRRELLRGGQVYFLHNEVATIARKAEDITALVPEARIAVAHGQMREHELEQVMSDFYHRRANVLICTTIVESGIDIPTANTIIIHRADKFGLAQLHQLRGRVGRSHHQAYAYLLIPSRKLLTPDAEKRLDAIASLEELGMGFTLATHDLEIRGAGELLGEEQSGNMHEIGFSLYMDLLSRAVEALKAGKEPSLDKSTSHGPEINLQISALIPESYLGDVHLRLQFYKRIAQAKNQIELDDIQVEMIDRFGLLPDALKNLIAVTELKWKAEEIGIIKIEAHAKGGKIEFSAQPNIDPAQLIRLIQIKPKRYKFEGPQHIRFMFEEHEIKDRIKLIAMILDELTIKR